MEGFALAQERGTPAHRTAHARRINAPREPAMAGGAIRPPGLEGHDELILHRALCRTSCWHCLLPMLLEDLQHRLAGLRMPSAGPLAIGRLQVLYLLVGHWLPSYDLLVPPAV